MKKKLSISVLLGILMAIPLAIFAQDSTSTEPAAPTFSFSGSVDTYFHTAIGTEEDAPNTAFANHKGFSLGMINLVGKYEGEKVGFTADMVFGPRGSDAVFASPMAGSYSSTIVNQLYAYWKPADNLTLTLGNFNTFVGYEVISPAVNVNYSTSYMFSYGPFSHTGLKANLTFGSGMNAMIAVMNPTDLTEFNPVNTYTLGGQLGWSGDPGFIYLNLLYGDQDGTLKKMAPRYGATDSNGATFQVDVTTGWNISDAFFLGVNATYNTTATGETIGAGGIQKVSGDASSFMGIALYPKFTLSESTALALRGEYFAENNGGVGAIGNYDTNGDANVMEFTLSLDKTIGNLILIPEVRIDAASEDDTWTKSESYGDTPSGTKTMPTFNFAAIYKF